MAELSAATHAFVSGRSCSGVANAARADTTSNRIKEVVGVGQLVSARAVRLGCIDHSYSIAAHDVDALRDGFKVRWIDTRSVTAQVVERFSIWDQTANNLVSESVGENQPSRRVCPAPDGELAVSTIVSLCLPEPAVIFSASIDMAPESLSDRFRFRAFHGPILQEMCHR